MSRSAPIVILALALAACERKAPPPEASSPADDAAEVMKALAAITATCARASGAVEVRRASGGRVLPLTLGGVLRGGDVVRTGPASSARIIFVSGGALDLEENATVEIGVAPPAAPAKDGAAAPAESAVKVQAGVVRGVLPPSKGEQALGLVIRGPDGSTTRLATEGSEPTAFRVTPSRDATEVAITKGEANVRSSAGTKKLRAGRAIEVASGGEERVVDLLDFPPSVSPGIDARFRWTRDLEIRLAWKPIPEAAGYRVQTSSTLSFEAVTNTFEVDGTEISFKPPEGMFAWRVAAHDRAGRLGEYGFARRVYCERDVPQDLLVGPADRATIKYSERRSAVVFTWQSAANAKVYKVVVATSPQLLAKPVVSRLTLEQRLEVKGLGPGKYFWGVFVDDGPTPEPIFQNPRSIVVQRAAKAKVKIPKSIREWGT